MRERVRLETEELKKKGVRPGLAVIIVGDDPASQVYVRNKEKACAEVSFYSEKYALPSSTTQQELNNLVRELNERKDINGILCQLPLPPQLVLQRRYGSGLPEGQVQTGRDCRRQKRPRRADRTRTTGKKQQVSSSFFRSSSSSSWGFCKKHPSTRWFKGCFLIISVPDG